MNTRISSAIETSVYVLATVMTPRCSRSILSSILQGKRPYTENGTKYPGLVYSEVNTLLTIDASGICEFGIGKREGHGASSLRLLLGLDALKRAIGSGSYSDKPASSRRPNSSAASRAEASLPVAADRRSIWFPGMRQVRSEWLAAVLAWRWAFF